MRMDVEKPRRAGTRARQYRKPPLPVLALAILLAAHQGLAEDFQVTSMDDAGAGSLRGAIAAANAAGAGPHVIEFDLPGDAPFPIQPLTELPPLGTLITLDGTTQPGFVDQPVVFLDGGQLAEGSGLAMFGNDSVVRGLAIGNFPSHGMLVGAGSRNRIEGCFLGTDTTGVTAAPNGISGAIFGDSTDSAIVDSVIAHNGGSGLILINFGDANPGAARTIVQGNFIGVDRAGAIAPNNGSGIFMRRADDSLIGGPAPGDGNLIGGNQFSAITLDESADGNVIEGNRIGTDASLATPLPNGDGIFLRASSNNVIAGNVVANHPNSGVVIEAAANGNLVLRNLLTDNELNAVRICCDQDESGVFPQRNTVSQNLIFGDPDNTPLELGRFDGTDPSDELDADTGPNGRQNRPFLNTATALPGRLSVAGTLRGQPGERYVIEFFASEACHPFGSGPGERFLGSAEASAGAGDGRASFATDLPVFAPAGFVLTATATSSAGDTSEFSQCLELTDADEDVRYFDGFEGDTLSVGAFID